MSDLTVAVHPALSRSYAVHEGREVLFLGDPLDVEHGTADGAQIAAAALRLLAEDYKKAEKYLAYLGGRFTAILWDGSTLRVFTDCAATMSVYWYYQAQQELSLSSHVHLLGEVLDLGPDEVARSYLPLAREMRTPRTLYVPGIRTPFEGVRPVYANHVLECGPGRPRLRRFYPFGDTTLYTDHEVAYQVFAQEFSTHVVLIAGLGRSGLSLTSGVDSRCSLAAALPHLHPDTIAWSYVFDRDPPQAMIEDVIGGAAVAAAVGIPHQVVPLRDSADPEMVKAYARTFRYTQQLRRIPHSYYEDLPADIIEMQSMVAEVGTGFYKNRSGAPDTDRLSYLYCPFDFGKTDLVRGAWEEYGGYAPVPADTAVDFHDLFYWESRIGRWGALRIQEVDLVHQVVSPFNSRAALEALLGLPLQDRKDKQQLHRFIEERAPELAGIPGTS